MKQFDMFLEISGFDYTHYIITFSILLCLYLRLLMLVYRVESVQTYDSVANIGGDEETDSETSDEGYGSEKKEDSVSMSVGDDEKADATSPLLRGHINIGSSSEEEPT